MEGEKALDVVAMTCGVIVCGVAGSFWCRRNWVAKKHQKDDQTEDRTQDLIRAADAVKDT